MLLDDDPETLGRRALRKCWTAARGCYSKKSFAELWEESDTLTDEKMLKVVEDQVIESGHLSVLRHVKLSFSIEGVSRATSHQLVRHHVGCDWEQQSQRYTKLDDEAGFVMPTQTGFDVVFQDAFDYANESYQMLLKHGVKPEDARAVLPNAAPTNLILSADLNALIAICSDRLCSLAQAATRKTVAAIRRETVKAIPWMGPHLTIKCCRLGYCPEVRNKDGHCRVRPFKANVLGAYQQAQSLEKGS